MDSYLNYLDEQTKGFSNIEKLRYAYIDLGLKFSFNTDYIFETRFDKKYQLYENAGTKYNLTTCFLTEKILCKDTCLMMKLIGEHLGFDVDIKLHPCEGNHIDGHVYNVVTNPDGSRWTMDLQNDIKYIRNYVKTKHFGREYGMYDVEKFVFTDYELELMDRKCGYLDDEHYNDFYYRQMREDLSYIDSLENKMSLILGNIEYKEYEIGEGERHFFHKHIVEYLLDYEDLEKVKILTCYRKENNKRKYFPAFTITDDNKCVRWIYYYDLDKKTYKKLNPTEFMNKFYQGKIVTIKSDLSPIKREANKIKQKKNRH